MLSKKQVSQLVKRYADEVVKELSPKSIVLYGSYAKGTQNNDSDIDVAVIYDGFNGDWLKTSALLWKLSSKVSLDIEPILLDTTKDKSGFVQNVLGTGEIIYNSAI